MRRLTAYVTMSLSILLAVGVSVVPAASKMNTDLDYGTAHEVVYNLKNKEDDSFVDSDSYIEDVASSMRERLDEYNIDSYSVRVEGNDTIKVQFATETDTIYKNVKEYLAFSGGDFSMATKEEESRRGHDILFKDSVARIEYVNSIPYVVIPVSDVSAMKTLIETATAAASDSEEPAQDAAYHAVKRAEGDTGSQADLFLWANWEEGDDYEKAEADVAVTGQKIIASFNSSNIWYKNKLKEDQEPTEIQYLCGYADEEGNYDVNKLAEANNLAVKIKTLFNAKSYDVNIKVAYEKQIDAIVDPLMAAGKLNVSITLVATGVALLIMALLLVVFYRLGALGVAANTIAVSFMTMFLFFLLGTTMNISALIGLILVTLANVGTGIFYMNKLKDYVYKGYSLKKANQESLKKYTLFTVDVAAVLALAGLAIYFLGGNMLKSLGVVVFFGGVLTLLLNETIFRILANFLCNSVKMQDKIHLLNFDKNAVKNEVIDIETTEEKETYKGAYAKKDFTKHSKAFSIAGAALVVVGAVMSIVFGSLNKTIINTSSLTKETTEVYLVLEYDDAAIITLKNEDTFKNEVLANIKVNGEALKFNDVEYGSRSETDYETTVKTNYGYFVTSFDQKFTTDDVFTYTYAGVETQTDGVDSAIYELSKQVEPYVSDDYFDSALKISHETVVNEPSFGWVSLACGVTLIAAGIYLAIRYGISRGLTTTIVGAGLTFTSIALFAITRLAATPVIYNVMPAVMIIYLVGALYFLNKEKELTSEVRTADLTPEKRHELMIQASSNACGSLFVYAIIGIYFGINFFGFGPSAYAKLFAGIVVGTILVTLFIPTILGPISEFFAKSFAKINVKRVKREKPKKQQKIKLQAKPKTSEPEETIFIGIND